MSNIAEELNTYIKMVSGDNLIKEKQSHQSIHDILQDHPKEVDLFKRSPETFNLEKHPEFYKALFDLYNNSGEMPHQVVKASSERYKAQWVWDKLRDELSGSEPTDFNSNDEAPYDDFGMDLEYDDDNDWGGFDSFESKVSKDLDEVEEEDCSSCNGTGWERVSSDEDERGCDDCGGTGKVDSVDEWVQDSPKQGFSGQERNFIQELCLRMDGVSKSPEGLKWMGKSKTWDEGNVLSDKGKLTTLMLWTKKNIDDLYHRMGSEFQVYSDGNDEGPSGRGQSDGNQILQNIIKKIGMVSEDNEDDDRLVSNCCGEYEDDRVTGGLEAGEHGRCSNCHDMAQFIPAKEFHESEEKLDEIDPSRSPWTKSGKHPGAMNREELEKELEVFDELQALGFTLSPKEIMQRDSLNNYLYK